MLNRYVKVIDRIKEEILSFMDEFEGDIFILCKDFMRFRFKTDDELVYNQKFNVPVCVISISYVFSIGIIHRSNYKNALMKVNCFTLLKSFFK